MISYVILIAVVGVAVIAVWFPDKVVRHGSQLPEVLFPGLSSVKEHPLTFGKLIRFFGLAVLFILSAITLFVLWYNVWR